DDDGDETDPAAFDYRIYQHAPERLLTAAGAITRRRPRVSVLAMMAGFEKPAAKGGKAMAKKPTLKGKVTAKTAADEDEDQNLEDEEDPELEDQDETEA